MTNDIYTYIFENFNIKVTDYTFKRDYIKNPLQKDGKYKELPHKDDLDYMFNSLHMSKVQISNILKIKRHTLQSWMERYDIPLEYKYRYSVNHIYVINDICSKYGFDMNDMKHDYIKNKLLTNELPNINDVKRLYIDEHCDYYDVMRFFNITEKEFCKIIKDNGLHRKTNVHKKIAVPTYDELYEKYVIKNTPLKELCNEYGIKKSLLGVWLKEYGIKKGRYKSIINMYKTNVNRYGMEQPNTSKNEDLIYKILKENFEDVRRHYVSKLYPYHCDFYIPKIDLYIEYNGHWTHGKEPYVGTKEQNDILFNWKNKVGVSYKKAIDTWTKRDVLKRKTAKDNGLNYLEFFNMNEFNEWFENFGKDIIEHSKNNIDNTMYNCLK